jgi:hypothetical protein
LFKSRALPAPRKQRFSLGQNERKQNEATNGTTATLSVGTVMRKRCFSEGDDARISSDRNLPVAIEEALSVGDIHESSQEDVVRILHDSPNHCHWISAGLSRGMGIVHSVGVSEFFSPMDVESHLL